MDPPPVLSIVVYHVKKLNKTQLFGEFTATADSLGDILLV
jgi:hypothetical protein